MTPTTRQIAATVMACVFFVALCGLSVWLRAARRRQQQALIHAASCETRFRAIIDASPLPYALHDSSGRINYLNPCFTATYGYTLADLPTLAAWLQRACPDLRYRRQVRRIWVQRHRGARHGGAATEPFGSFAPFEMDVQCNNGQTRSTQVMTARLGEAFQDTTLVILHDITERKKVDEKIQLAASVMVTAREGIMMTDAHGNIIEVNEAFTRITGYAREEVLGGTPRLLQSGKHDAAFYATLWQSVLRTGHWSGEIWNRRKSGDIYPESVTISAVRDELGQLRHFVALFADISTLKAHQQQLEHVAHHDALTHLPNRTLLADRLQQAMLQSQRRHFSLAVVYLDLDGFKRINDQYGHDVGDELLITLAQRMSLALRDGDTLARVGGDEFVAVLVDLSAPEDCNPVLDRLLAACAETVLVRDISLQVSASLGVTVYPQDGGDVEQLLRHADQAMYQAKQSGKNCYQLFDVQQESALQAQRRRLTQLHQALDQHEFVLHYQPKANMKTGAVTSVEALVRWQHPERGLLLPAEFLPFIEDHPIGIELGEWVLAQALAQLSLWQQAGLAVDVSVNIGVRQLLDHGFSQRLAATLARQADVAPLRLELDVREASAVKDLTRLSEVLSACRALGVRVALDNFGTGYFSFTQLKHLPAGSLKIDRRFVHDMLDDRDNLAIVKSVIALAAAFRREVVAEGVETVPHGAMLLQLGCALAQGYGIAHPMPPEDLPGWLANWRPDAAWQA